MKHDAQNKQECHDSCFHIHVSAGGNPSTMSLLCQRTRNTKHILFWRISEKPEQVTQDRRACSEKTRTNNVIHVQSETSNALQD